MDRIEKSQNKKKLNWRLFLVLVLLALVDCGVIAFRGLGRWLVREDPPAHVDVIAVLSGGLPYRAAGAAKYFELGYANEVWITRPEGPGEQLKQLGVSFTGEEEYSRQVLVQLHVPENDIRILPNTIINTEQEVEAIVRALQQTNE